MNINILSPSQDPMGQAIQDYFQNKKAAKLRVFSSQFDEDEIPVDQLFRTYGDMPSIEKTAIDLAKGSILDVGAGSGCHSLILQEKGKDVTAIDISPLSVEVMKERGIKKAFNENIFDEHFQGRFDTILFMMNGSGIIGKIKNLPAFFSRIKQLLNPGGCLLMDSTDVRYLFEDEDGSFVIDLADDYYGETDFQMQYKNTKGEPFDWLYIDFQTLELYAAEHGFKAELIQEGEHYDYLASLKMI